jgi:hypothetical protein
MCFCRYISLVFCLLLMSPVYAQQTPAPSTSELAITTESLPQAALQQGYRVRLQATAGIAPLHWSLSSGSLPVGLELEDTGIISGVATEIGDYRFSATVTDSDRPSHSASKGFTIRVVAPLVLEWSRFPTVQDNRIDGAVKVTNGTSDDFDFTLIAVAVNEIGKAFALGYQHFDLGKGTPGLEIPFGSTLPQGSYVVHVDAVGEVPSRNAIYRRRLHTASPLQITVGP